MIKINLIYQKQIGCIMHQWWARRAKNFYKMVLVIVLYCLRLKCRRMVRLVGLNLVDLIMMRRRRRRRRMRGRKRKNSTQMIKLKISNNHGKLRLMKKYRKFKKDCQ